jgi:hypothetical protein
MPDPKHPLRERGPASETVTSSFIRHHEARDVAVPPSPTHGSGSDAWRWGADEFLEDWALRHFTVSVQMHDVERVSEGDPERRAVLEDLASVQGILLELHDFASGEPRVRAVMRSGLVLQNGVAALYAWLGDVLSAAARLRVTQGKPGFVDGGDEALGAILRSLERVHPDLEALVRPDALGVDLDVARKLSLCFRQIGAAVVRVSGRAASSFPPR